MTQGRKLQQNPQMSHDPQGEGEGHREQKAEKKAKQQPAVQRLSEDRWSRHISHKTETGAGSGSVSKVLAM